MSRESAMSLHRLQSMGPDIIGMLRCHFDVVARQHILVLPQRLGATAAETSGVTFKQPAHPCMVSIHMFGGLAIANDKSQNGYHSIMRSRVVEILLEKQNDLSPFVSP